MNRSLRYFQSLMALLTLSAVETGLAMETDRKHWGAVENRAVYLFSVTNTRGMVLRMTNYGARITELWVPDRNGILNDVVLGFDNLQQYLAPNPSFGATIGRFANRIRDARFEIDSQAYPLTANEGHNLLHGGGEFENAIWEAKWIKTGWGTGIQFSYLSQDGNFGFPGNLKTVVTYILTEDNAVQISFEAETDQATHVNITQHSYFNLNGMKDTIHEHRVRIDADRYLLMDGVLATGETDSLEGKPWDLSSQTRLGDRMGEIPLGGYHHNYVANKSPGELAMVARVVEPESGRTLDVSTTQPGVVFYAAMGLTDMPVGKNGVQYAPYYAFCLETQHHIDSPNHPQFPSTLLRPGERYLEEVIYDFGVVDAE